MGRSARRLKSTRSGVVNSALALTRTPRFALPRRRPWRMVSSEFSATLWTVCALEFFCFIFLAYFEAFLFLLQYHHWHCSAGKRGSRAWATAAQKVSSTQ